MCECMRNDIPNLSQFPLHPVGGFKHFVIFPLVLTYMIGWLTCANICQLKGSTNQSNHQAVDVWTQFVLQNSCRSTTEVATVRVVGQVADLKGALHEKLQDALHRAGMVGSWTRSGIGGIGMLRNDDGWFKWVHTVCSVLMVLICFDRIAMCELEIVKSYVVRPDPRRSIEGSSTQQFSGKGISDEERETQVRWVRPYIVTHKLLVAEQNN